MDAVVNSNDKYNNVALDVIDASEKAHPQDIEFEQNQIYEDKNSSAESSYLALLPLLLRLDQRISLAVAAAEKMFASRAAGDLYRGLAISPEDIAAALQRIPGEPLNSSPLQAHAAAELSDSLSLRRLLWLQRVYGLSNLDLDIIIVGLAPEIDLRYERLYAYLQDDVSKRRPSIDLGLNILSATGSEKLEKRNRFAPDAPLVHHRLIEIYGESQQSRMPLLAKYFKLDEQVVRFLLLGDSLDSRLAHFCSVTNPTIQRNATPLSEELNRTLNKLAEVKPQTGLRVHFEGKENCGQDEAVNVLANALEMKVLCADMTKIECSPAELNELTNVLVREAWFRSAVLNCKGLKNSDEIITADKNTPLWHALKEMPVNWVIQGEAAWQPSAQKPQGVITFTFDFPDSAQRKYWWHSCLSEAGATLNQEDLSNLANRFKLTFAQIEDATKVGINNALTSLSTAQDKSNHLNKSLIPAARAQSGHELLMLADKIIPKATWDDLILNDDAKAQLSELCDRAIYRERVLHEWDFAKKLARGLGASALFSGGSGTGKTMAAEVIANTLGLDLYRIDLARLVNKYVGETEKNLNRVFSAAENANAILFFDEADALFGKRTEVKDGHDHYANLQVSHLLQKMEEYDGLAILATNLNDNMDQAFTRRLAFSIHFPFPDEIYRLHMWQRALPSSTPRAEDLDLPLLAKELKLCGGNIKNIGLAAAFLAAADGDVVTMQHLIRAAEREHQKLGKAMAIKLREQ